MIDELIKINCTFLHWAYCKTVRNNLYVNQQVRFEDDSKDSNERNRDDEIRNLKDSEEGVKHKAEEGGEEEADIIKYEDLTMQGFFFFSYCWILNMCLVRFNHKTAIRRVM